jgi:protein-ribulosamine 3-kinase
VSHSGELAEVLADLGSVVACRPVGGGCISHAMQVTLRDRGGEQFDVFVKRNSDSFLENFRCEADGLRRLAAAAAIGVPQVLRVATSGAHAYLVTQWVELAAKKTTDGHFFEAFGRSLAQLHHHTRGEQIGLDHDNFLGSAKQINTPAASWSEFVQQHRLGFQLRWAVDQHLAGAALQRDVEAVIRRVPQLLAGRDEQTSLLHGDLWSGNYLCDAQGEPVLIDPAVYYGCREAEFGMLKLFGGCPAEFYEAYEAQWPLPQGWQRRAGLYILYHLLNHLNLFGTGYLGQVKEVLRMYR